MAKKKKSFPYKVLVTGATGFVGANLVRRLVKDNWEVHILAKHTSDFWRIKDIKHRLKCHFVDLNEPSKLSEIIKKIHPEIIFHLAVKNVYSSSLKEERRSLIKTNLMGTVNLIKACDGINYKCFVNTGSSSEYGLMDKPVKESDLPWPITFYGSTKYASTLYAQMSALVKAKPIVTLRLFSPYGPYDSPKRLISNSILTALKNRDLKLTRPGIVRDYVYIEDVIDAYLACIDKAENLKGETFNIGRGREVKVEDVVKKIVELTASRSKLLWNSLPVNLPEPKAWQADLKKSKELLGWQPQHSIESGLAKTIDWFKNNLDLYK